MNEFYDDVKARKALVPITRNRVCGSHSKKCTLPSETLTLAQQRAMNSPVRTYRPSRPMSWAEFRAMPADLQQEHLDYVQNRFHVGLNTIARLVWGTTDSAAYTYAKNSGLRYQNFRGRHNAAGTDELKRWLGTEPAEPTEPVKPTEPVGLIQRNVLPAMLCSGTVLRLSGTPEELAQALLEALAGRGAELEISIRFEN